MSTSVQQHDFSPSPLIWLGSRHFRCTICDKKQNDPAHVGYDPERDADGWPKRWSDSTYLGDGPWGP